MIGSDTMLTRICKSILRATEDIQNSLKVLKRQPAAPEVKVVYRTVQIPAPPGTMVERNEKIRAMCRRGIDQRIIAEKFRLSQGRISQINTATIH